MFNKIGHLRKIQASLIYLIFLLHKKILTKNLKVARYKALFEAQ